MDKLIERLMNSHAAQVEESPLVEIGGTVALDAAKLLRECQAAMASFVETEGNGGGEVERHVAWFKELLA